MASTVIKSYIINLDRDVGRMSHMRAYFRDGGIDFERISAVDGRLMTEEEFKNFFQTRSQASGSWLRGQVGCFLSHYAIWTKIALGAENCAAIFEDDIHVAGFISDILTDDAWLPEDFDIIRLETSTNRMLLDKYPIRILSDRFLYRLRSTSWCAGAYILSRSCARKLISVPKTWHNTTDYFLFCHEHSSIAKELTVYQFSPALATQDQFLKNGDEIRRFSSNINEQMTISGRLVTYIRNITPYAICNSLYKSLLGFKRVPFRP